MFNDLDSATLLSESMRAELMIELSGISLQESLVVKSMAGSPLQFEKVASTLIEQYGAVHLRGGRTLSTYAPSSSGRSSSKGMKGKGKGKPPYRPPGRSGFYGSEYHDGGWTQEYGNEDQDNQDDYDDGPYLGLLPTEPVDEIQEYAEEEVEEWEAIVLNAVSELGDQVDSVDMTSAGEALQLELAALATKAKGKKGKGKGKGKGIWFAPILHWNREEPISQKSREKANASAAAASTIGPVIPNANDFLGQHQELQ